MGAADGLRLDRFISTRLVWPALRGKARAAAPRIPILMYHGISPNVDRHRRPYFRTVTSPETFATHLRLLGDSAFQVVTLSVAVRMLRGELAPRAGAVPVVISFDDGLLDFHTTAFPLLERAGFPATVFLASACVDGMFPTGVPCLTSAQVRELAASGIEFGSHSRTHPRLVEVDPAQLDQELAQSRADIETILGLPVTLFSYPFRFPAENTAFVEHLHARLEANGYRAGVTTMVGRAGTDSRMLFLPRLPANDCDDPDLFLAKLQGAYDWFGPVQTIYKRARSTLGSIGRRT